MNEAPKIVIPLTRDYTPGFKALTLERKRGIGLMFPVISSEKRRAYFPVGSTAASMPPTFSPETTEISCRHLV